MNIKWSLVWELFPFGKKENFLETLIGSKGWGTASLNQIDDVALEDWKVLPTFIRDAFIDYGRSLDKEHLKAILVTVIDKEVQSMFNDYHKGDCNIYDVQGAFESYNKLLLEIIAMFIDEPKMEIKHPQKAQFKCGDEWFDNWDEFCAYSKKVAKKECPF